MQIFNLDISEKKEQPWLLTKQGDVGRRFQAVITDAGEAYSIGAGTALSVWYAGTSGEGNYTAVGDHSAFTVQGNTVTVELITQMLSCKGGGTLCLLMNAADGRQIGMWDIPYQVEGVPGGDSAEARQYYTAFSEAARALQSYADRAEDAAETFSTDTTLKISGKAADAKATGDALAQKAPLGCGLGSGASTEITEMNQATTGGSYAVSTLTKDSPASAYGVLLVLPRYEADSCTQVYFVQDGSVMVRHMKAGVWGEWEYENPPMADGVEYRTTGRSNGKVVYTKRINFGAMPNASYKNVSTGLQPSQVVSYRGVMRAGSGYVSEFPVVNASMAIIARAVIASTGTISVTTAEDLSTSTAEFVIHYTKD